MLVKEHVQQAKVTAAGPAIPVDVASSFAATQAAWRFWGNEAVTPTALVEPLRQLARQQIAPGTKYVLSVIDWSKIDYKKHTAKTDVVQLTHQHDVGYELTTQLLVDAGTGRPIAPIQSHLKTRNGYLTTAATPVPDEHRLEQITPLMDEADGMNFGAELVYVIDREADSVWHFRQWNAAGRLFVVRGDDRRVNWRGQSRMYREIAAQIDADGAFVKTGDVTIKGRQGVQYVAETTIVLNRSAKRKSDGKSISVKGEPLTLRLVIAKVFDAKTQKLLSVWYLLSNVPSDISAAQIALWYYWRWSIESYFKLMKSGGQELEHWQQESGPAILKRLLVASMASSTVWQLQGLGSEEAREFKQVLVRLSGKSMKRGRSPTSGSLLSGLFVLLRMFDFLCHIDFDLSKLAQLKSLLKKFAPHLVE